MGRLPERKRFRKTYEYQKGNGRVKRQTGHGQTGRLRRAVCAEAGMRGCQETCRQEASYGHIS